MGRRKKRFDPTDLYDQGMGANDPIPPMPAFEGLTTTGSTPSYLSAELRNYDPSEYIGYLGGPVNEAHGDINLQRGMGQSGADQFGNMLAQTVGKFGTGLLDMAGSIGSLVSEWGDERDYQNGLTYAAEQSNKWIESNFPIFRSTNDVFGWTDPGWWAQNTASLTASVGSFAVGGMGVAKLFGALGKAAKIGRGVSSLLTQIGLGTREAIQTAQFLEKGLTAGMLAYTEGAMSARETFRNVYQHWLSQGADEQTARHYAAESAATTAQLNTITNTVMNMIGGMGMFFDHERDAVERVAKQVLRETSEEAGSMAKQGFQKRFRERLQSLSTEEGLRDMTKKYARELGMDYGIQTLGKKGLTAAREATAEGVEEMTNLWAEQAGTQEGKKGNVYGIGEQLKLLEDYFKYTWNEEGALNFMLGAVAGPVQNTLAAALPVHKVNLGGLMRNDKNQLIDAKGNVVTDIKDAAVNYYQNGKRVTAAKKNRILMEHQMGQLNKMMLDDIDYLSKTQQEITEAISNGDVDKAASLREQMFQAHKLKAVAMGMGSAFKNTYASIMDLDNTKTEKAELMEKAQEMEQAVAQAKAAGEDTTQMEVDLKALQEQAAAASEKTAAMKLGFASQVGDESYKEKAKKTIEDIDAMEKIYDMTQRKFKIDDLVSTPEEKHLSDFMFSLYSDHYLNGRSLEEVEKEIAANEAPVSPYLMDVFAEAHHAAAKKAKGYRSSTLAAAKAKEDLDRLVQEAAKGTIEGDQAVESILNQYGVVMMDGEDVPSAVKRMVKAIDDSIKETRKKADEEMVALTESEHYKEWAEENKGKTLEDYFASLELGMRSLRDHENLMDRKAQLELRQSILKKNIEEIEKKPTLDRLMKNAENFYTTLGEKLSKMMQDRVEQRRDEAKIRSTAIRYHEAQKTKLKNEYQRKINELAQQVEDKKKRIEELNKEIKALQDKLADKEAVLKNKISPRGVMEQIDQRVREIQKISEELKTLTEQIASYKDYLDLLEDQPLPVTYEQAMEFWQKHKPTPPPPPPPPPPSATVSSPPPVASGSVPPPPPPPPSSTGTPVSSVVPKTKHEELYELVDSFPDSQEIYFSLQNTLVTGKAPLGLLVPLGLTSDQSAKIVTLWKEIQLEQQVVLDDAEEVVLQATATAEVAKDETVPTLEQEEAEEQSEDVLFSFHEEPDEDPENLTPTEYEEELGKTSERKKAGIGNKVVEAAKTGASQSTMFTLTVAPNETKQVGKFAAGQKQSPNSMQSKVLTPNTKVKVVLDLDFEGEVIDHSQVDKLRTKNPAGVKQRRKILRASSFIDPSTGLIILSDAAVDEFPMEIQMEDGSPSGQYIRTVSWVKAQDPNSTMAGEEWLNVADVIYIDGEPVPGNVEHQVAELRRFRRSILESYNAALLARQGTATTFSPRQTAENLYLGAVTAQVLTGGARQIPGHPKAYYAKDWRPLLPSKWGPYNGGSKVPVTVTLTGAEIAEKMDTTPEKAGVIAGKTYLLVCSADYRSFMRNDQPGRNGLVYFVVEKEGVTPDVEEALKEKVEQLAEELLFDGQINKKSKPPYTSTLPKEGSLLVPSVTRVDDFQVPFKVVDKGPGALQYLEKNGKRSFGKAVDHLKEAQLIAGTWETVIPPIVLFAKGSVHGSGKEFAELSPSQSKALENRVLVLLKMANGTRLPRALKANPMWTGADTKEFSAFVKVLETFLSQDAKAAEAVRKNLSESFNPLTSTGLKNLLAQYFIHSSPIESTKDGYHLIVTKKGVKVVFADGVREEVKIEVDGKGKLTTESREALKRLASKRYRSVAIDQAKKGALRGIGNRSEFTELTTKKNNKGEIEWDFKVHEAGKGYDHFLLGNYQTDVTYVRQDQTNRKSGVIVTDSNGQQYEEFFYGVNPVVTYNFAPTVPPTPVISSASLSQPAGDAVDAYLESMLEANSTSASWGTEIVEATNGTDRSIEDLATLEDLLKFVPESDRNGKTPEEVRQELLLEGIRKIPVTAEMAARYFRKGC